jgi:hypothetical protein
VNAGDLISFQCIGAGKTDNPPYSQDGEWRIGLIVKQSILYSFPVVHVFYRGVVVKTTTDNCRVIGEA